MGFEEKKSIISYECKEPVNAKNLIICSNRLWKLKESFQHRINVLKL